jgi:hypothetical protein
MEGGSRLSLDVGVGRQLVSVPAVYALNIVGQLNICGVLTGDVEQVCTETCDCGPGGSKSRIGYGYHERSTYVEC